MSFSFTVTRATKDEAALQVKVEMDTVVANQPEHAADAPHVLSTVEDYLTLLVDDPTKDVYLSISGSLQFDNWSDPDKKPSGVNVSVYATLSNKAVAAPVV